MENQDFQTIESLVANHPELQPLLEEHILLSKQVEKLEAKPFLTPSEEVSLKELKKQKLDNKTLLHAKVDALQ